MESAKRWFFTKLLDDTIGYYRIYDYLKIGIRKALKGAREFKTSREFWCAVLGDNFQSGRDDRLLQHGEIVVLKDFFLTEWTPKLPGKVWTKDGSQNLLKGLQDVIGHTNIYDKIYEVLGPEGKQKMINGGFGSVRLKPSDNQNQCMLLNAVHLTDWHCDYGIPIVVSKPAYEHFLKFNHDEGAPVIKELKATYHAFEPSGFKIISSAIGAKISSEITDVLSDSANLPKCFLYVSSHLDLDLLYNQSHPNAIAWTMFATSNEQEPLRLTYATFDPKDEDSATEATMFIQKYVRKFEGTEILTDFDGQKRRLQSKASLTDESSLELQFLPTVNAIQDWAEQQLSK